MCTCVLCECVCALVVHCVVCISFLDMQCNVCEATKKRYCVLIGSCVSHALKLKNNLISDTTAFKAGDLPENVMRSMNHRYFPP